MVAAARLVPPTTFGRIMKNARVVRAFVESLVPTRTQSGPWTKYMPSASLHAGRDMQVCPSAL
jgi:hypothetical protein